MNHIPTELYQKIHAVLPIVCVDVVVVRDNSFLLAKRNNKPAQGQWFFPGGRIFKGEGLEDAAKRKAQEELGIEISIEKILGVDETMFPDGPFDDSTHTINVVFLANSKDDGDTVALDTQNEEYQWYTHIDDTWHPYVKKFLVLAGFTKSK
ncbi:MAG: NUDIX domain-containing protein [Candidatus Pacebacteria bacterium]|jgi:colanic acid biosynthesis protein WcaH|nr:NUDIX domain-containing protein [Candidatus Paceibacterota bacterium]